MSPSQRFCTLISAVTLAWAPATVRADGPWGGLVTATSDYVFRGVSESSGRAALQADLHASTRTGWFIGAWATTADPPPGDVATYEVNLYLGRKWTLSNDWGTSLTYVRYVYPDSNPAGRYDSDEFIASLEYEDRAALTVSYSPNSRPYARYGHVNEGRSLSYEASLRQPLAGRVALLASAGYYDTDAIFGYSYWAGDVGLAVSAGRLDVTLTHFITDATARELFGRYAADGRWVATATWRF